MWLLTCPIKTQGLCGHLNCSTPINPLVQETTSRHLSWPITFVAAVLRSNMIEFNYLQYIVYTALLYSASYAFMATSVALANLAVEATRPKRFSKYPIGTGLFWPVWLIHIVLYCSMYLLYNVCISWRAITAALVKD